MFKQPKLSTKLPKTGVRAPRTPSGGNRRLLQKFTNLAHARQLPQESESESSGLSKTVNVELPPKRATAGSMLGG